MCLCLYICMQVDKLLQSDAERAEEKESEGQQSMMMGEEQQRLFVCSGGTDSVLRRTWLW